MGDRYQLEVTNNSTEAWDICVHQRDPEGGYPALPVAWLVEPCPPSSRTGFSWTTDFSFVWGQIDRVVPGAVFRAAGSLEADPDGAKAVFDDRSGYRLERDRSPAQPGSLVVQTGPGIPFGAGVAVGIGMSGSAITVADAQPNIMVVFSPRQECWLAAGRFEAGQVLDPDGVPNAVRVSFPAGVSTMTATFAPDRRWTVKPG